MAASASNPLSELARDALRETRDLIRAEGALATSELRRELRTVGFGVAGLAIGLALLQCALLVVVEAVILQHGVTATAIVIAESCFVGTAAICIGLALRVLGRRHLGRTRSRLQEDVHSLLERPHE